MLPQFYVDDLIKTAIKEDINYIDLSTDLLFSDEDTSEAYFISKDEGVLCGINEAMRVFELLDPSFDCCIMKHDGDKIKKGDIICEFEGTTRYLLNGERTALNIIQHCSGIATATAKAVKLVAGTGASVADTRKTLPGLRPLEKYAVMTGGGKNHRYNLSDAVMLKDNHIDACGGIKQAVEMSRSKTGHTVKIEVETRDLDEVQQALDAGADIIMLDNMSESEMKKAVKLIAGRAVTEASGGITDENIKSTALTGVDIISMGALTHSAKGFDISMKIKK